MPVHTRQQAEPERALAVRGGLRELAMATAGLAVDDAVRRLKRAATTAAAARAWRRRHRP